jgi:hypothetical protein
MSIRPIRPTRAFLKNSRKIDLASTSIRITKNIAPAQFAVPVFCRSPRRSFDLLNLFQGMKPVKRVAAMRDALAGVVFAAMDIPQVLGYTRIAGMPVVTGLYALLLPLLAFATFGSSRYLVVSAPTPPPPPFFAVDSTAWRQPPAHATWPWQARPTYHRRRHRTRPRSLSLRSRALLRQRQPLRRRDLHAGEPLTNLCALAHRRRRSDHQGGLHRRTSRSGTKEKI